MYGVINICCNLFLFINGSEKKLLFNETIVLLSTGVFVYYAQVDIQNGN